MILFILGILKHLQGKHDLELPAVGRFSVDPNAEQQGRSCKARHSDLQLDAGKGGTAGSTC